MTLQQLEYIVAVDKYRHFVKAAESCGVTQSTLSSMIQKLEQELDVKLFDRNAHPVIPTLLGEQVITQARVVLFNASQLKEMVLSEKELETGEIRLGIIPTVAPYLIPSLIKFIHEKFPKVNIKISEARTSDIINHLSKAELDMAILATPIKNADILEIPLYYEKFVAYVSPFNKIHKLDSIETNHMPSDHLWVLHEGHCLRNQIFSICDIQSYFSSIYQAGSIDTLVKIVDENGGYTIIPELHIALLSENAKNNIRPLINPEPFREISLTIRHDYVRERMLNIVYECILQIIPEHMINSKLKKNAIKL